MKKLNFNTTYYYGHLERFPWPNQLLQQQIVVLWYLSTNGIFILYDVIHIRRWHHEDVTMLFRPPPPSIKRLSQTGSRSSSLSRFSFGFQVLIWMASRILKENSLGSRSNALTFSLSIWWALLLMGCSLMANLELPAVDLCNPNLPAENSS